MDVMGSLCSIPFVTLLLDDGKLLDGKGQGSIIITAIKMSSATATILYF
jgi:hypothetical protein